MESEEQLILETEVDSLPVVVTNRRIAIGAKTYVVRQISAVTRYLDETPVEEAIEANRAKRLRDELAAKKMAARRENYSMYGCGVALVIVVGGICNSITWWNYDVPYAIKSGIASLLWAVAVAIGTYVWWIKSAPNEAAQYDLPPTAVPIHYVRVQASGTEMDLIGSPDEETINNVVEAILKAVMQS